MKEFFTKLWATLFNRVVTNWKTTVGGILTIVVGWLVYDGVIPSEFIPVIIMLAGFIGIGIKDPRSTNKP